MAKKRGKKKTAKKKSVKHRKKPKKKEKKDAIAITSFVLAVISSLVGISYIIAVIMSRYTNGSLVTFTYLAALVIFMIGFMGAGLAVVSLDTSPKLAKTAFYVNFIVVLVTFIVSVIRVIF